MSLLGSADKINIGRGDVLKAFVFLFLSSALFLACGRTEQKVELKSSLPDDVNDASCKRGKCPQIDYSIVDSSGFDVTTKTFEGLVKTPIEWAIKVKSTSPAGRVRIVLKEYPIAWMNFRNNGAPGSLMLFGTPDSMTASNSVTILARDISRCVALSKDSKNCSNVKVDFDDYDKIFIMKYTIKDQSAGGARP